MIKLPAAFYKIFTSSFVGLLLVIGLVYARPVGASSPVNLHNKNYVCKTFQDHQIVNVTNDDNGSEDGVFINDGCTGTLDVHIVTNAVDGIKIHSGDHKGLIITGSIICTLKHGVAHQDGVQAMGGSNVQLGDGIHDGSFIVHCPTGNNGGLWVNTGSGGHETPTNIVCDHCSLFEGNAALHINNSIGSGARNTVLYKGVGGAAPADCKRINTGAVSPVVGPNLSCVLPPQPLSSDDAANYHGYTGPYSLAQAGCGLTAGACWLAGSNPPPVSPNSSSTGGNGSNSVKANQSANSAGSQSSKTALSGSPNGQGSSQTSKLFHGWNRLILIPVVLIVLVALYFLTRFIALKLFGRDISINKNKRITNRIRSIVKRPPPEVY
jgi:hypothetical protein